MDWDTIGYSVICKFRSLFCLVWWLAYDVNFRKISSFSKNVFFHPWRDVNSRKKIFLPKKFFFGLLTLPCGGLFLLGDLDIFLFGFLFKLNYPFVGVPHAPHEFRVCLKFDFICEWAKFPKINFRSIFQVTLIYCLLLGRQDFKRKRFSWLVW